ncbi:MULTISPECIES: Hvo_1808 family surface protein [unclassified Haladaptatus]|uniref:Hvo_1808 family surface protein n=1 Tax=unclassified Haladaptatus TaxID=2622732 RepID=UPI0023E87969|nr:MULTISPECIES: Hvo_1808 family surface protein [unclassified Haladaptatus]
MRALASVLVALLLVLSGCSAGLTGEQTDTTTETPSTPSTAAPTTDSPGTQTPAPTPRPDPESDVLGWENGYWHDAQLSVNTDDGLNETELDAIVARAMARVEHVRELEFQETVPVEIITRAEYQNQSNENYTDAFRAFDNTKFEAMFFVGEDRDALDVQNTNRGSNVLGYFSPKEDAIVIVANSDTPSLDAEGTLSHELVHALQDQHFNLSRISRPTRELHNGRNGLIEGEANYVQRLYMERCGGEWECLEAPDSGGGGGVPDDFHWGIYFLNFFPYSDGPGFVGQIHRTQGWDGVNGLYSDLPNSSEQIIYPQKYGEDQPTDVTFEDTNSGEWERVVPESPYPGQERPAYASLGQSALSSMFAHTFTDEYNRSRVVEPQEFINYEQNGRVNSSDPFNYDLRYTRGWDGDRMHVYWNDAGETAYVWQLAWDSPQNANQFVTGYERLLQHWGAEQAGENTWVIPEGEPYADTFWIHVEGDTVTIVNAPTEGDLPAVYDGAGA